MDYRVCLWFIMIHFFYDFTIKINKTFQNKICRSAKIFLKASIKENLYHSVVHFIFMSLPLILLYFNSRFQSKKFLVMAFIIAIVNFIIYQANSVIRHFNEKLTYNVYFLLWDQITHIISILIITIDFNTVKFYRLMDVVGEGYPKNLEFLDKLLVCNIVFIICTHGIPIFIRSFVINSEIKDYSNIKEKEIILKGSEGESLIPKNFGFAIGVLERVFILLVIVIGQPVLIGVVLTTKYVMWCKKDISDNGSIEYFLITTFISFIGSIIGGLIIKSLNIFPLIK